MKYLFLDLDDTILDFQKAEEHSIIETFKHFNIEPNKANIQQYSEINQKQWKLLEKKETTRERLKVDRYRLLFEALGREDLVPYASEASDYYLSHLSECCFYLEDSLAVIQTLAKSYDLYITSNGNKEVQRGRLDKSELKPHFKDIFISEEIGYNKPDIRFFEACFARIPNFEKDACMIIGDSLTSDIAGGKQAVIHTCYLNLNGAHPASDKPEYTIYHLRELLTILG